MPRDRRCQHMDMVPPWLMVTCVYTLQKLDDKICYVKSFLLFFPGGRLTKLLADAQWEALIEVSHCEVSFVMFCHE